VRLVVGRSPASDQEVEVVFQNVSADDLWLYLGEIYGEIYGNGFYPSRLGFTVKDGERVTRGRFLDMAHANVGGRIGPYLVPLRAGSSYSLRIRFAHMITYESPPHSLFEDGGPRRPVLFTVEWVGSSSESRGPDARIRPTNLVPWPGHLFSNTVSLGRRSG
jgi:hypothetical protein